MARGNGDRRRDEYNSVQFPEERTFNLSSQLCRAADSVALNISEGSILQSKPEFRKFMGYSIRSLAEVVRCLHKAKNRNYINDEAFQKLYDASHKPMNMMIAFRNKI